jgi:hypothetical protein
VRQFEPDVLCACGNIALFQCDYAVVERSIWCSKPICSMCAEIVYGELDNQHFCPEHRERARLRTSRSLLSPSRKWASREPACGGSVV